ncbi:MAG TPA: hypothetical protein VG253_13360 [Streptosporangiaceae bacterium]|nr:hypothetical protein [Streptosporangiaceae bacterium]
MYPLPEEPDPKPARLRPLPGLPPPREIPQAAVGRHHAMQAQRETTEGEPFGGSMPLSAPVPADVLPSRPAPADPPLASSKDRRSPEDDMRPPGAIPRQSYGSAYEPGAEQRTRVRDHMEAMRSRASAASSWLESSRHYARLVNREGVVPVAARFSLDDISFLAEAREQMLRFAELTLRLVDLHQPLDAGGISTDPSSPILRCRSCMWRWPCPTFSVMTEVIGQPPLTGPQ